MGTLCCCIQSDENEQDHPNKQDSLLICDPSDRKSGRVDKDHFIFLKLLGLGECGKVYLVKKIDTGELLAMKILKKKDIDYKRQRFHTINEKNIMMKSNSPFIVKLRYSFQDYKSIYIVMEYIQGGELFNHIKKLGRFPVEHIKFYIAEIILAIEYLHSNGIIYRDLRPENVLVDEEGHIKLTDFGLSKTGMDDLNTTAYTFCGSPSYLAPEIIKNQGHNRAVDYWSLGVMVYEMVTGKQPFASENKDDVFKKILNKEIQTRGYVTFLAEDLINKLLTVDPQERLRFCERIKEHQFFEGIEWDRMVMKEVKAPFKPNVTGAADLKLFDSKSIESEVEETLTSGMNSSSYIYQDFTYNHDEKT